MVLGECHWGPWPLCYSSPRSSAVKLCVCACMCYVYMDTCVEARGWCWMSSSMLCLIFERGSHWPWSSLEWPTLVTCPLLPYQGWDSRQLGTLSCPAFYVGLLTYAARLYWPNHFPTLKSCFVGQSLWLLTLCIFTWLSTSAPDTWWFEAGRMDETIGKKTSKFFKLQSVSLQNQNSGLLSGFISYLTYSHIANSHWR